VQSLPLHDKPLPLPIATGVRIRTGDLGIAGPALYHFATEDELLVKDEPTYICARLLQEVAKTRREWLEKLYLASEYKMAFLEKFLEISAFF
jgi:hypothetical protein